MQLTTELQYNVEHVLPFRGKMVCTLWTFALTQLTLVYEYDNTHKVHTGGYVHYTSSGLSLHRKYVRSCHRLHYCSRD